ncbi:MAG: LAGLIDADG family homing endonuclease [Nanoarchaeota archaeon]
MELTKELAEILGMFAADGNMQDGYVCMWGSIHEDQEYYNKVVCPLFSMVLNKKVAAHEKPSNSVYGFYICDKNVVEKFKEFGFTKKKTYNVKAPKIILNSGDKEIIASFIRGFTDCDGCLNFFKRYDKGYTEFRKKYHSYPRILIQIASEKMIDDLGYLLGKLGINYSRHIKKSNKANEQDLYVLTIRGNNGLKQWIDRIGFNNPSKYFKYLIWKKYGFCPTPLKYSQEISILSETSSPYDYYNGSNFETQNF